MSINRTAYMETILRMEPNIAAVDVSGAAASMSISLKRIADFLEAPTGNSLLQQSAINTALSNAKDLIEDCANTFREYERNHRAKNTDESDVKATANARLAERCEQFLKG